MNVAQTKYNFNQNCLVCYSFSCFPKDKTKSEDMMFRQILTRLEAIEASVGGTTLGSGRHEHSISYSAIPEQEVNQDPFSKSAELFEGAGERRMYSTIQHYFRLSQYLVHMLLLYCCMALTSIYEITIGYIAMGKYAKYDK